MTVVNVKVSEMNRQEIKSRINSLSAEQRILRSEFKTVHFVGTRVLSSSGANAHWNHYVNGKELRKLHTIMALLHGKTHEQIERKVRKGNELDKWVLQEIHETVAAIQESERIAQEKWKSEHNVSAVGV